MPSAFIPVMTVGLLLCSNIFMTLAWYGHLKFKAAPLRWNHAVGFSLIVAASWFIFHKL